MEVRAAYAFLLALFLAMVLIPPLVHAAGPLGLMDSGGGRKVHAGRIPRIGGVAIFVGFLVPVLVWTPLRDGIGAFVAALAVLFVFGLLDDRFNLDYRLKLLGQLLAAAIVVIGGAVLIQRVPYWPGGLLPVPLALPLTLLVLAGVTNAVNLSDGLDGLAGGISLLAVCCLLVLDAGGAASPALILLAALLGAVLGFLRFNTYPARLFMGDAGSQLLGFSVGVLAIMITQRPAAGLSPVLPLLVLGVPILDMLTVMARRIARGRSPFHADRTHLHHRLIAAGLSQAEAVSLIYGLQFLLLVLAYLLRDGPDGVILLVYAVFCLLVLLGECALEQYRVDLHARPLQGRPLTRVMRRLRRTGITVRLPYSLLRLVVPLCLVIGALGAPSVGTDIGLLAASLCVLLLLALWVRRWPVLAIERLSAYTAAAAVCYLLAAAPVTTACPQCLPVFFGVVAIAVALWVRVSSAGFQVSTLDVLILLGALTAPMLRDLGLKDIGILVLQAIILFYAIEILLQARERCWDALRLGTLAALMTLAARGLVPF
ncbi:MraY family glycosyltransferase [uncultured Thiohalocapsa sp.]|uniref:MraY family glycosyltransferase n=1 Tax=uncultured Thiohalocapsa sp. TaxID=768990 RepID=UPI0025E92F07|nr:MraY family glycosyltransferase [uncultured Thiohalocapsa sp.]